MEFCCDGDSWALGKGKGVWSSCGEIDGEGLSFFLFFFMRCKKKIFMILDRYAGTPFSSLSIVQCILVGKISLPAPPTLSPVLQIYILFFYFRSSSKSSGCCFENVSCSITPISPSQMGIKASQRSNNAIPPITLIVKSRFRQPDRDFRFLNLDPSILRLLSPSYLFKIGGGGTLFDFTCAVAIHSGSLILSQIKICKNGGCLHPFMIAVCTAMDNTHPFLFYFSRYASS